MAASPLHPIQVAARRCGLSVDLVRAWERRYQAVKPKRSPSGQRLYRNEDIERLRLLTRATHAGRRIGNIAQLSNAQLTTMVEEDEQAAALIPSASPTRPRTESVMAHFDECSEAIDALDLQRLSSILNDAEKTLDEPFMQEELIVPLVQHLRDKCRQGSTRMAQVQMALSIIRGHLVHYISKPNRRGVTPLRTVIAGTLSQTDELPLLHLAVAARAFGWQPLYLGTGLPADEIAFAAEHGQALCTVVTVTQTEDALILNELRKLRHSVPKAHPILLQGTNLIPYQGVIADARIHAMHNFSELRVALDRIRQNALPNA